MASALQYQSQPVVDRAGARRHLGWEKASDTEKQVIDLQLDNALRHAKGEGSVGRQAWMAAYRQVEMERRGANGNPTVALQIARGEVHAERLQEEFHRTGDLGVLHGLADTQFNLKVLRGEEKVQIKTLGEAEEMGLAEKVERRANPLGISRVERTPDEVLTESEVRQSIAEVPIQRYDDGTEMEFQWQRMAADQSNLSARELRRHNEGIVAEKPLGLDRPPGLAEKAETYRFTAVTSVGEFEQFILAPDLESATEQAWSAIQGRDDAGVEIASARLEFGTADAPEVEYIYDAKQGIEVGRPRGISLKNEREITMNIGAEERAEGRKNLLIAVHPFNENDIWAVDKKSAQDYAEKFDSIAKIQLVADGYGSRKNSPRITQIEDQITQEQYPGIALRHDSRAADDVHQAAVSQVRQEQVIAGKVTGHIDFVADKLRENNPEMSEADIHSAAAGYVRDNISEVIGSGPDTSKLQVEYHRVLNDQNIRSLTPDQVQRHADAFDQKFGNNAYEFLNGGITEVESRATGRSVTAADVQASLDRQAAEEQEEGMVPCPQCGFEVIEGMVPAEQKYAAELKRAPNKEILVASVPGQIPGTTAGELYLTRQGFEERMGQDVSIVISEDLAEKEWGLNEDVLDNAIKTGKPFEPLVPNPQVALEADLAVRGFESAVGEAQQKIERSLEQQRNLPGYGTETVPINLTEFYAGMSSEQADGIHQEAIRRAQPKIAEARAAGLVVDEGHAAVPPSVRVQEATAQRDSLIAQTINESKENGDLRMSSDGKRVVAEETGETVTNPSEDEIQRAVVQRSAFEKEREKILAEAQTPHNPEHHAGLESFVNGRVQTFNSLRDAVAETAVVELPAPIQANELAVTAPTFEKELTQEQSRSISM